MDKPVFYVSGPEPMVESLDKTLKKLGVQKKRVKNDFFPGYHWP
jgi:ferredoxin-NADP reductase